jgi:hypothetical protein
VPPPLYPPLACCPSRRRRASTDVLARRIRRSHRGGFTCCSTPTFDRFGRASTSQALRRERTVCARAAPAAPACRATNIISPRAKNNKEKLLSLAADLIGALIPVAPENHAAIVEPEAIGQLLRSIDGPGALLPTDSCTLSRVAITTRPFASFRSGAASSAPTPTNVDSAAPANRRRQ